MVSFNVKINEKVHEIKDVDSSLFVGEVKSMVENMSGVPKDCQKWIYKGRILSDLMSLSESTIVDGNTVIVMRTAQPSPALTTTAAASTDPAMSPVNNMDFNTAPIRIVPSTAKFDKAMFELLQNSDEAVVQAAVSVLLKVITNIILQPSIEKYRRLSRTNAAFTKKVGNVGGGSNCMIALGFQLIGDEWVLVPCAEAWENITSCKAKLEKFSQKLSVQMATSSSIVAQAASVESTTLPPASLVAQSTPLSPQAVQLFLQSLAAMQASMPSQPSSSQEMAGPTSDMQEENTSSVEGGEKDEEEEIIPQL